MSSIDLAPPESTLIPARSPRTVSRRSVLGGLGLGSLAALIAPMFGLAPTATADPTPPGATPTPGGYRPILPYLTRASCQLTEDYFLTDEVLIDLAGGDQILPFTTQAGGVEAIVVTGSGSSLQVAHLARDTTTTSGWSYTTINTGLTQVVSAAVIGTLGQSPLLMVLGSLDKNAVATKLQFGGNGWAAVGGQLTISDGTQVMKAGIGPAGPFFYAWGILSEPRSYLTVQLFDSADSSWTTVVGESWGGQALTVDNVVMRWDPQGKDGWVVVSANGSVVKAAQNGATDYVNLGFADPVKTPNLDTVLGAYGTGPGIVWQDTTGQVNITVGGDSPLGLAATAGSSPSSVTTGVTDNLVQFAFCLDETVTMISQVQPTLQTPFGFTPGTPMLPGIARVFGLADVDPTQSVLFAVDLDTSLSVLSYGPTGWTQNVVRQASATVQEVTGWQCQVTVTDANGIAVPGATVRMTTDRPVAVWQEGETNGTSTTLQPEMPVTFTCDGSGQLLVALPTDELDAAQLLVQALDRSNQPTGSPLSVAPDADVQAFFAGTGGLDSVGGPLNSQAIATAKNTSWDTATQAYTNQGDLFPAITKLPTDSQQTEAANDVAKALIHVATLPTTVPAAASDIRSACLDLTGAAAFTTSSDPNHFEGSATGDKTWWQKAESDADSFFHGLRHGAIHLAKLVSSWDADAKNWGLNLVITLEDDVQHLVNFVVTTAKEAIHAISSVLHALGADIEKAWNWLKNFVLGILVAAETGAKVIEAWIGQLTDELQSAIGDSKVAVNGFFTKRVAEFNGWIDSLESKAGAATFGSSTPDSGSIDSTGSSNTGINWKDVGEAVKVVQHCNALYWLNKLKKYLPHQPSDGGPSFSVDLTQVATDVHQDVAAAGDTASAIFDAISDVFKTVFANKSSMMGARLATVFDVLEQDSKKVVDDILTFLDAVVVNVLDLLSALVDTLDEFFSYEFQAVPVIGGLLEHAGIDTKISIQHITCLIATFPAAVVYRAMGHTGDIFPPQTDDPAAVKAWADDLRTSLKRTRPELDLGDSAFSDPWGAALNLTSFPLQLGWMFNDVEADAGRGTLLTTIVDIAAPTVLNILNWPSKPISDSQTGWPFRGGVDKKSTDWGIIPAIIIAETVPPLSNLACLILKKDKGGAGNLYAGYNGYVNPVINGIAGIVCAVLGGVWSGVNHEGLAVAEAVIGNLSYIFSFAGISPYDEDPDVKAAKFVADAIANFATALLFVGGFSAAD